MSLIPPVMYVAWSLGLLPLAFVAAARAPRAYWWLAAAFGISWLADAATLLTHAPWWVSRVYPVSQSALACAVFLNRKDATGLLTLLVLVGLGCVFLEPHGPEVILHLTAWLFVAMVASEEAPQPLRRALVVYFGLGSLVWVPYALHPTWPSTWWDAYQGTRALGIALFGLACWKPAPILRVV